MNIFSSPAVGDLAEENTVEAFELAWKLRLYPESDLRMTKDGVIVPFHDGNFARVVKDASRKVEEIRAWKALVPESETLLWMHGNEAELRRDFAALRQTKFAGLTQVQIHVYPKVTSDAWAPPTDESPADNPFRLRNAFLVEVGQELRAHGILFQTFPYTKDPAVYAQLLDLGVMSFATDYPDVTLREIKAYYAARQKRNP